MTVRFTQSCPTCGRRIEVRAALIGRTVACQHCRAEFLADISDGSPALPPNHGCGDASDALLDRVEQVLEKARQHPTAVS